MNGEMYPPNDSVLFLVLFLPSPAAKRMMDQTHFRGQKTLSILEYILGCNALHFDRYQLPFPPKHFIVSAVQYQI
jgi:hypothetical protein